MSIYVRDHIEFTVREDLSIQSDMCESLVIEIDKSVFKKKHNMLVGVFYRPPDINLKEFYYLTDELLQKVESVRK